MSERLLISEARTRIIAATAAVIEERGAVRISVTEVMRRAEVSRTAFYRQSPDVPRAEPHAAGGPSDARRGHAPRGAYSTRSNGHASASHRDTVVHSSTSRGASAARTHELTCASNPSRSFG